MYPQVWCGKKATPPSVVFLAKNQSINEKNIGQNRLNNNPQKSLTSTYKTVQDMKNKEGLRNCHRSEENKKTWQGNTMRYPGLDLGTEEKVISGKTDEI